ncbi:hypothetical protein [Sinorhizobium meliloti]|uniref:hypothetical protein n=1 Tax=Rhizobium meliloti TaxID=382 RepID=UPI00398CEBC6
MADKEKMKQLIWDCQKDIAAYLPPASGISEHQLVKMLIARLDGSQAKEALATIGKAGGRMTMMAVETTVPSPAATTGAGVKKRALFRNIADNTAFERRSHSGRLFSPSEFRLADNRTCRTTAALLIASAGALLFLLLGSGQIIR